MADIHGPHYQHITLLAYGVKCDIELKKLNICFSDKDIFSEKPDFGGRKQIENPTSHICTQSWCAIVKHCPVCTSRLQPDTLFNAQGQMSLSLEVF